jgi:hypothetical protein
MTRPRPSGSTALAGTAAAKQLAAVVLEVLSGACGPAAGSQRLGISLPRYYALETRGLQALVAALEPRPRGRMRQVDSAAVRREQERLERDVLRLQALVRTLQRAVAVAPPPKEARRRRKTKPRATKVIAQLRAGTDADSGPAASERRS